MKVAMIPPAVQEEVLFKFVTACRELHAIAFFQWRKRHVDHFKCDLEEVDDLISCRYDALFNVHIENYNKVKFEPQKNFLLKFKFAQTHSEHFAIESFEQIGMPDPFGPKL